MSDINKDIQKQIDAYVKGELTEEQISDLWVEFAKNPALLDDLELEVGVYDLIKKESASSKKAPVKSLPSWTWHAAAAAVLVLVALVQLFQIPSKTSLDEFLVAEIGIDQIETSNGIRAKEMVVSAADSILNLGFSELVAGKPNRALSLFNEVIRDYDVEPYSSKAFLNKGIVYYNTAEYDSSIVAFLFALDRVSESKMIEEKAYWYLGNAYANVNELEKAREAVFQAYLLDGVFRESSFLLIQKLNYDLGYTEIETDE